MCETWQGWAESLLHFVELTDQCLCCEKLKAVQQHCRGVVGPRFTIANSVSICACVHGEKVCGWRRDVQLCAKISCR